MTSVTRTSRARESVRGLTLADAWTPWRFREKLRASRQARRKRAMAIRTAKAEWNGNLTEGKGTLSLGSGAYQGPYSFQSRFESGSGASRRYLSVRKPAASGL